MKVDDKIEYMVEWRRSGETLKYYHETLNEALKDFLSYVEDLRIDDVIEIYRLIPHSTSGHTYRVIINMMYNPNTVKKYTKDGRNRPVGFSSELVMMSSVDNIKLVTYKADDVWNEIDRLVAKYK